jgi:uncharacterized protein (DUF58 family)
MFLLDASRSNCFGSVNTLKRDLAAEVCAVLAAAAAKNNDKVGLMIFTDKVECFVPPRKGTKHVFKVIREALYFKPKGKGTDIPGCLRYLQRITKKKTITFIISDFYAEGLKMPLSIATKRHDVIAVHVTDPRDSELPDVGIVRLEDPETEESFVLDTSDPSVREGYSEKARLREAERKKLFYSVKVDRVFVDTAEPYEEALISFFDMRKKKR